MTPFQHSTRNAGNRRPVLHSIRRSRKSGFFQRIFKKTATTHERVQFLRHDRMHKTYINPYFQKSLIPKRTKAKKTKIVCAVAALFVSLAVLFYHPFFDIQTIIIQGNQKIQTNELSKLVWPLLNSSRFIIFKHKNFFTLDKTRIIKELKRLYAFEKLTISRAPFSTLKFDIKERTSIAIVKTGAQFYFADKEGRVIGPADQASVSSAELLRRLPQIWIAQDKQFAVDDIMISSATIQFVASIFKMVPDRTGIALQNAVPQDEEGKMVHFLTGEGWYIYMDRQNDWNKQITVLKNILDVKFKNNNRTNIQYIDVRYENRAYIK